MNKGLTHSIALALVACSGVAVAQDAIPGDMMAGSSGSPNVALGTTRPLGLTQGAWNEQLRNRGQSRSRPGYVRYIYDPQQAFPIRAREGMITTIKVPEDETITQAFVGDEAGFQVGMATPQSIVVKALFPGVDTNLIAYSESGNIYTFYLRSEGYNAREISDFLVDVIHPAAGAITGSQIDGYSPERLAQIDLRNPAAAAQRIRDPYATQRASANPRYREYAEWTDFDPARVVEDMGVYVMRGEAGGTIPYRVFRDDRFTYIDYGPNAAQMTEWPTPLIVIQGVEGPVGNRTAGPGGRLIVIEALGEFVLRNGQRSLVIKPRHTRTDPTLIEYPTADPSPMQVPSELPPGQASTHSNPLTVIPDPKAKVAGRNGEPASIVVPVPDAKESRQERRNRRNEATQAKTSVTETPVARGNGAPIRSVIGQSQDAATGAALTGQSNVDGNQSQTVTVVSQQPVTFQQGNGSQPVVLTKTMPAPVAPVVRPVQNTHVVSLGTGTRPQLEDRWRSMRVQYYTQLKDKNAEYGQLGSSQFELRITPITSAAEGVRICNALATEPNCTVRQNNQQGK